MTLALALLSTPALAWLGDDGTYNWSGSGTGDSDAPTHVWVDVPAEPGAVMLGISASDDATENLSALGTGSFRYYGTEYTFEQIWVSTNGVVLFTIGGQFVNNYCCSGQPIPQNFVTEPVILPFWTDLNPSSGGEIWAVDTGTEIVISWIDVPFFASTGSNSVQVGLGADGSFRISIEDQQGNVNQVAIGHQRDNTQGNQVFFGIPPVPAGITSIFVPEDVDDDGDGFSLVDDCDDDDPNVNPGVVDTTCDGVVSDCSPANSEADLDGDGVRVCEGDCDDMNPFTFPGAPEDCDNLDNDCDGDVDEGNVLETFYVDMDFDGWGDETSDDFVEACFPPFGYAPGGDCNDDDFTISPFEPEFCDAIDHDCDGDPELGAIDQVPYQVDSDGDGYGVPPSTFVCTLPPDAATQGSGDCDDTDASIFPDADETPFDGIDNNCDGYEELDRDNDGISDADEYEWGSDWLDEDTDDDGVLDGDELAADSDPNNGDTDGDGVGDAVEHALGDSDGDGTPDILDTDDDGDGWDTLLETGQDFDGDGTPNHLDLDSDDDTILDEDETEDSLLRVDEVPKDGCGCQSVGGTGAGGLALLLGALLLRRR